MPKRFVPISARSKPGVFVAHVKNTVIPQHVAKTIFSYLIVFVIDKCNVDISINMKIFFFYHQY